MANTIITPEMVAKESLAILRNNCVYKDLVHTNFSSEFVDKIGDTVNVRKPASLEAKDFAGSITKQTLTESKVAVVLDKFKDVSVEVTSKDWTLKIRDFAQQIINPAMAALGEQVDQDIVNTIFENAGNTVSRTDKDPTDLADIADVAKYLDANKAPLRDRSLVLATEHNYKYGLTDNLLAVNYSGDNAMLRDANLGRIFRMQTFLDQNNPTSTASTSGTAVGTIKVASSTDAGEVDLTDGSAAAATLKIGDGFVYGGILYRFTEDVTLSTNDKASMAVSPDFPDGVDTATEVYIVRNGASLGFHRDAFAFVNRPLAVPQGAVKAATASADGLSVRVIFDYDSDAKSDIISFDILYGVKTLREKLAVRLVDGTLS